MFVICLPKVFNTDLALIFQPIRLQPSKDLAEITELAQYSPCLRGVTSQIENAAECHRLRTGTRHGSKSKVRQKGRLVNFSGQSAVLDGANFLKSRIKDIFFFV